VELFRIQVLKEQPFLFGAIDFLLAIRYIYTHGRIEKSPEPETIAFGIQSIDR
jgi:hypothetical protein